MIETMTSFDQGYNELSPSFEFNNNNNNSNNNPLMLPSMTISSESKTPYTDATQVREVTVTLLISRVNELLHYVRSYFEAPAICCCVEPRRTLKHMFSSATSDERE